MWYFCSIQHRCMQVPFSRLIYQLNTHNRQATTLQQLFELLERNHISIIIKSDQMLLAKTHSRKDMLMFKEQP